MCGKCERIYLLAHPDNAKRIQLTAQSESRLAYHLTCMCKGERYFDRAQILAYRVSEYTCSRGYAERDEYHSIPNQKLPQTRGS